MIHEVVHMSIYKWFLSLFHMQFLFHISYLITFSHVIHIFSCLFFDPNKNYMKNAFRMQIAWFMKYVVVHVLFTCNWFMSHETKFWRRTHDLPKNAAPHIFLLAQPLLVVWVRNNQYLRKYQGPLYNSLVNFIPPRLIVSKIFNFFILKNMTKSECKKSETVTVLL